MDSVVRIEREREVKFRMKEVRKVCGGNENECKSLSMSAERRE